MSTTNRARGGGGGKQYFPVGRRRYVPVVDSGCGSGCRPRRPSRLLRLPSFLKPCQQLGGKAVAVPARRSGGEQYSFASTSTASFSSSSAATRSSGYSSAAYSSDDYYYAAAAGKQQQGAPPSPLGKQQAATKAGKKQQLKGKQKKKRAAAAEESGVGVAVEKESSDPRADFRESMVQMVVEMGLCDWDGLRGMLGRLLALNAPRHHAAILTAFAEVCTQLAGAAAAATAPSPPQPSPPPAYHQYRR
ncbi:unnamed protein product [Urochloa humidicola]